MSEASSKPLVVGIGGTMRPNSFSERMVRAVLAAAEREGAATLMFGGPQLAVLPHYAPEAQERTPEQMALVDAIRRADGVVIGTPGYHAGVSGLVKNAIDLLEDLRTDTRCYFEGRAVGLVVTAAGWQACGVTLQAMRGIVHAMRGWPTPIAVTINSVADDPFDPDGALVEGPLRDTVAAMARQVLSRISTPQAVGV